MNTCLANTRDSDEVKQYQPATIQGRFVTIPKTQVSLLQGSSKLPKLSKGLFVSLINKG